MTKPFESKKLKQTHRSSVGIRREACLKRANDDSFPIENEREHSL